MTISPCLLPIASWMAFHNKQKEIGPGTGEAPVAKFYVRNLTKIEHCVREMEGEDALSLI